ncbi:hypothetical protein BJV74DRAFT_799574 [Russula compacta]|nr:hypothetical protein BJV74DRAFT_799574 [Russula compacta]
MPSSHMHKKHQRPPSHVHPPFPSFAWVMTAQANPPARAYANGYIHSAHLHNGMHTHTHTRLPAHRAAPRFGRHRPNPHPRFTNPLPSPSSLAKEKPKTKRSGKAKEVAAVTQDEKFMDTVDYRYHDPPPRPYVAWHEGCALRRCGAQQKHQLPQQRHHRSQCEHALPPAFAIATPAFAQTPPAPSTGIPNCRIVGGPHNDDDDDDDDHVRPENETTTTIVDDVKIKRLDIMLSALRRACGLSSKVKIAVKAGGGRPSEASMLT